MVMEGISAVSNVEIHRLVESARLGSGKNEADEMGIVDADDTSVARVTVSEEDDRPRKLASSPTWAQAPMPLSSDDDPAPVLGLGAAAVAAPLPGLGQQATFQTAAMHGVFNIGEKVIYWSETHSTTMEAIVKGQNITDGVLVSYDLDVKRGALPSRITRLHVAAAPEAPSRQHEVTQFQSSDVGDGGADTQALGAYARVATLDGLAGARARSVTEGPAVLSLGAQAPGPMAHRVSAAESEGGPESLFQTPEFVPGDQVRYWSDSYNQWMPATVQRVREDREGSLTYDLDIKRGAHPRKLKAGPTEGELAQMVQQAQAQQAQQPQQGELARVQMPAQQVQHGQQGQQAQQAQAQMQPQMALQSNYAPQHQFQQAAPEGHCLAQGAVLTEVAGSNSLPVSGRSRGNSFQLPLEVATAAGDSEREERGPLLRMPEASMSGAASPPVAPPRRGSGSGTGPGWSTSGISPANASSPKRFVGPLFMGTGVEFTRMPSESTPTNAAAQAGAGASQAASAATPGAAGASQGVTFPPGGLCMEEIVIGSGPFNPTTGSVFSQLVSKMGLGSNCTVEEMTGFKGGLNEGIWFLRDPNSSEELVLKLVRCHRIAAGILTEAENLLKLARDFPSIVEDRLVSFPVRLFGCFGSDGAKRHDLIVMRKMAGERLAEVVARKWYKSQVPQLMRILERLGRALAGFHGRYTGCQHGDFQPSNVFYDEDSDEITLIDIGGMGVPTTETDIQHFTKSMALMASAYGPELYQDGVRVLEQGYMHAKASAGRSGAS